MKQNKVKCNFYETLINIKTINMKELNEAIACYIEELVDIKRNKELTVEEKCTNIQSIGLTMTMEKDFLYIKELKQ